MKKIVLLFTIFLASCTGHHSENGFDLKAINETSEILLSLNAVGGEIEAQWWPVQIRNINPSSIRKNDQGIYIVLRSFFTSESGLYIPAQGINVNTSKGVDPSYILLNGQVYSYHVKG